VAPETLAQRKRREERRRLFDSVAELYDTTRRGYPAEIVDAVFANAGIGPGAAVLEIGCGTGQLTGQLAGRGFNLTAIDIGAAMVEAAKCNMADPTVRFQTVPFEEFADDGPFDLIISATAFHWVDPDVGLAKAAQLLRPGGWLALLSTGERYPEPLHSELRALWMRYSRQSEKWADQPRWLTGLRETTLFGTPIESSHDSPVRLPAETVLGLERTRATFLSFSKHDQVGFAADLAALLADRPYIDLVQDTFLAMAPKASSDERTIRQPRPVSPPE